MTIKVDDNILLELLDNSHALPVLNLIEANRNYLKEWLPWVDNMQTIGDFKNYIDKCKVQHVEGSDLGYVIILKKNIVGRIGLHNIDHQNKIASIGYWLDEKFTGKGIISKSCKAVINYAYHTLNINRIEIKCGTGNNKSRAIAEKLGFKKEGILREAELVNNTFIDLYIFSMLKNEWAG
jgi:ribosomal-protein-serine acetyltransferase